MLGGSHIKGFILSVIVVFLLLVSNAPSLIRQNDNFFSVGNVAASPSEQANNIETLWLDAYSSSDYARYFSQNALKDGRAYKITIEGTFSAWYASNWTDEDYPPVGLVEGAPIYPGQDGGEQTGPVGTDPYWGFACPFGLDYAQSIGAWPMPWWWTTMISLDNGASWNDNIRPIHDEYNPMHKYEVIVVGKGEIIGFWIYDGGPGDCNSNYGMLKIVITPDTDEDGLFDDWEMGGIDINCDGKTDLNLNGSDWMHKDIFVEVDYMQGHRPMDAAMDDVRVAFSRAPNALVNNPDGKDGVNLHIQVDEQTIHQDVLYVWEGFDSMKSSYFGSFEQRTAVNSADILQAKKMSFRYCLFIHQFADYDNKTFSWNSTKASGVSELPGNDFIVSLGTFRTHGGTKDQQAAAFMHELGHALNLRHGGSDDVNYKPNYLSIMNYLFEFDNDPIPDRPLDYSRSYLPTLDETHLDEMMGVSPNAFEPSYSRNWVMTAYSNASGDAVLTPLCIIDWNNNHWDERDVSADINNFTCYDWPSGVRTSLAGYEDWSNLLYDFRESKEYADGVHMPVMDEITSDMVEKMQNPSIKVHDLAILNVTCASNVVETIGNLSVDVLVENQGDYDEQANISLLLNSTEVLSQPIALTAGENKTVHLTFTLGSAPGVYLLTVNISQATNESDLLDNRYEVGNLYVSMAEPEPQSSDSTWIWIAAIGVVMAAAILIAYVMIRRKKG